MKEATMTKKIVQVRRVYDEPAHSDGTRVLSTGSGREA